MPMPALGNLPLALLLLLLIMLLLLLLMAFLLLLVSRPAYRSSSLALLRRTNSSMSLAVCAWQYVPGGILGPVPYLSSPAGFSTCQVNIGHCMQYATMAIRYMPRDCRKRCLWADVRGDNQPMHEPTYAAKHGSSQPGRSYATCCRAQEPQSSADR